MSLRSARAVTRRRFLAAASVLPLSRFLDWEADEPKWSHTDVVRSASLPLEGLPPRVIGMRSLGGNFRFDPEGILLEVGTDLHWLNMGDFHTTTAFHPENAYLLDAGGTLRIPEGAQPWHSGLLGLTAGTRFTHHFEVEGVYDYFCHPHFSFGMVGRIVVGRPRAGPAVTEPLPEFPPQVRENMPALEEIMGQVGVTFEWASRLNGVLFQAANGRPPRPFADAVVLGMRRDSTLQKLAGEKIRAELYNALDAFAASADVGPDYEAMVRAADTAKRLLRQIHQVG